MLAPPLRVAVSGLQAPRIPAQLMHEVAHSSLVQKELKEKSAVEIDAHPSPCPHKNLPSSTSTSPSRFHLCLSRSSGRVKLSKSVLIIRTGTHQPAYT